jgi:malic enzyme
MTDLGDNTSEEHIVKSANSEYGKVVMHDIRAGSTNSDHSAHQEGIIVTKTYEVSQYKSTLDV